MQPSGFGRLLFRRQLLGLPPSMELAPALDPLLHVLEKNVVGGAFRRQRLPFMRSSCHMGQALLLRPRLMRVVSRIAIGDERAREIVAQYGTRDFAGT